MSEAVDKLLQCIPPAGHSRKQRCSVGAALFRPEVGGIARERPQGDNHRGKIFKVQSALKSKVILPTTQTEAPSAAHWSCRSMVRVAGTTHRFVHRVWQSPGLNPAENADVFSVDESMPAPDLTQPELPLKAGRFGSMPLGYAQCGTASLCAAVEVASSPVIRQAYERCRAVLQFLRQVDNAMRWCRKIRITRNSYATCKPQAVMDGIERQERIFPPCAPARASRRSLIKRHPGVLTERQLRRGSTNSVQDPERSLKDYLKTYNENSRPVAWTKTAGGNLDNAAWARHALAAISA